MHWQPILTSQGLEMLAQHTAGLGNLTITRAEAGSASTDASALPDLTALSEVHGTPDVQPMSYVQPGKSELRLILSNASVQARWTMRQIGIYAKLDDGAEALFVVAQREDGTVVPSVTDSPGWSSEFSFALAFTRSENVSVEVADAARSAQIVMQSMSGKPGGVASLGEDGKLPLEQLPEIDYAPRDHTHTAAQVGAADAAHKHSAADITSGILAVERGGTGASSMAALVSAISASSNFANLVYGTYTTSEPEQGRVVLGFRPKFVLMFSLTSAEQDKSRFVHTMWGAEGVADSVLTIEDDGFRITNVQGFQWSERNPHFYLALR